MDNLFFSIIIPVYNVEVYFDLCVASILGQTYGNFELILINDGSTDSSGQLCDLYATRDNRIKVLHQSNKGVSVSRNCGIKQASGQYIVFIDADDFIEPDRLALMYEATDKTGTDIIVSDFETFDSQSMQTIERMHFSAETVLSDFIAGDWAVVWRLCIGKKCIDGLLFNEEINYGEDYLFTCQALCNAGSVKYAKTVKNSAYKYRKNNLSSLMRRQKIANIAEQCRATECLEEYLTVKNRITPDIRRSLNRRKNWCRTLLFNEACTLFGMKRHFILLAEKKIYRIFLRNIFSETKE